MGRAAVGRRIVVDAGIAALAMALGIGLAFVVGGLSFRSLLPGDPGSTPTQQPAIEFAAPPVPAGEPSGRLAVTAFLEAEQSDDPARSFELLSDQDRLGFGSAAQWAARRDGALGNVQSWEWVDSSSLRTRISLESGLSPNKGWTPAAIYVDWATQEDEGWRVSLADSLKEDVVPDAQEAVETASSWLADPERCARAATPLSRNKTSPAFAELCLLGGRLAQHSSEPVSGALAADLAITYGGDPSTWARLVPLASGTDVLLVALGNEWIVIDAFTTS